MIQEAAKIPSFFRFGLAFCGILFSAFFVSGPVRGLLAMPIETALIAALVTELAFIQWARKKRAFSLNTLHPPSILCYVLIAGAASFLLLYHPSFRGLVSVGGGDAGNHVFSRGEFIRRNPLANSGLVSFFALSHWLSVVFALDPFASFRAIFYGELLILIGIQALFFSMLLGQGGKERPYLSFVVLFAASFIPAKTFILPHIHYLQAAGFFPQLSGILPLALCTLLIGWTPSLALRVLLLFAFFVVQRFTYTLNLGDFAVAASIVLYISFPKEANKLRCLAALSAAVFIVLAGICYSRVQILFTLWGGILPTALVPGCIGTLLASSVLILMSILLRKEERSPAAADACIFAGSMGAAGSLFQLYIRSHLGNESAYYLQKYNLLPSLLVGIMLPAVVAYCLVKLSERVDRSKLPMLLALVASSFSFFHLAKAYQPYAHSFWERVERKTDSQITKALCDVEAESIIRRVLAEKKKTFAGYLVPDWPLSNFLNASLGYYGEMPLYRQAHTAKTPNSCVFWSSSEESMRLFAEKKLTKVLQRIDSLSSKAERESIRYRRKENGREEEISYVCRM